MKIGFDAKRAFFNRSGLGNYSRWFIDALTQFHAEHEYYLFKPKDKQGVDFEGLAKCKVVTPQNYLKSLPSVWRSYGMVKESAFKELDIYHGLSHELPIGINKTKVKSVVTMHDAIFMRFPELFDYSYRLIFKQKYQSALDRADGIIAISEQSKSDIVKYFDTDPNRVTVIYQGCNPIYYTSADEEKKKAIKAKYNLPEEYMLYVGTIEPRKNLLGVFKALVHSNIDMPIVAVGRATKYLDEIKEFVAQNGLENRSIFLHNVETEELPALYQQAQLFVYPSLFEGFGIPILEALNSGTPVVTSKGSCFPEVGGTAAQYAEYGNTEELGETIKSILNDQELQNNMIQEGKKQALNFREETISTQLINYYKALLA